MDILLLVVGFSLIVILHEFGHFLAAKYVGIKVEQFAMGFGPAIFSWRKGLGFRLGSTEPEQARRIRARSMEKVSAENAAEGKTEPTALQYQAAERELGFSETEYRWNWVPLGGYVKMMGQDDSKPGLVVNDPRSYTSKTVGQRMLVISAGVIMNIIFAGVAFMITFMAGLEVPEAVIGSITPMAPAQMAVKTDGTSAPLRVGDQILTINGTDQLNDFRKIALNAALAPQGKPMTIEVKRREGNTETVQIVPEHLSMGGVRLLAIGVGQPRTLAGPDLATETDREIFAQFPPEARVLQPGERISAVNGQPVAVEEYYKFYDALQQAAGRPVEVTITAADGKTRQEQILGELISPAVEEGVDFAGMIPRTKITGTLPVSSLEGKAKAGDVVTAVSSGGDVLRNPTPDEFRERVAKATEQGLPVTIEVLRGEETLTFENIQASVRLRGWSLFGSGGKGLGVGLGLDMQRPVVSGLLKDSPVKDLPAGSTVRAVNGVVISDWNGVLRELRKVDQNAQVELAVTLPNGEQAQRTFAMDAADKRLMGNLLFESPLAFGQLAQERQTSNPLKAAMWGVTETRDSILQVYVTLRRLVEGSVPFSGMMGPVGMVSVGTQVIERGFSHFLWFLAIISANLAVVNFLPVPVVDGGHFLFLTIEKIQGKPISEKTMVVAQYIGLAMILSLFVAVTYQDILRLITY